MPALDPLDITNEEVALRLVARTWEEKKCIHEAGPEGGNCKKKNVEIKMMRKFARIAERIKKRTKNMRIAEKSA